MAEVLPLDPERYVRHALHSEERVWPESNCYVDLWIELLHGLGLDPVPCLAPALAVDFEGDQWTFFKPQHADLYSLYGVDVQEMTVWRPIAEHLVEQVGGGRIVLVEVDSFFLPDTAGVSHHIEHTKTTIGVQAIDVERRTLGYFHNASYFALDGDDFDGVLQLGAHAASATALPPYVEIAKLGHVRHEPAELLATRAAALARDYIARGPSHNPMSLYRERWVSDAHWLSEHDMDAFHKYAFATLRQMGSAAELSAVFLRWLGKHDRPTLGGAATQFDTIASQAKALQFKLARAVNTKKPANVQETFDVMDRARTEAFAVLSELV
jgi:hypothetical protein